MNWAILRHMKVGNALKGAAMKGWTILRSGIWFVRKTEGVYSIIEDEDGNRMKIQNTLAIFYATRREAEKDWSMILTLFMLEQHQQYEQEQSKALADGTAKLKELTL